MMRFVALAITLPLVAAGICNDFVNCIIGCSTPTRAIVATQVANAILVDRVCRRRGRGTGRCKGTPAS